MLRPLRVLLVFVTVLLAACVFTTSAPADDDDDDDGGGSGQVIDFASGAGTAIFDAAVSDFDFHVQSVGGVVSGGGSFTTTFGLGGTFVGPATCLSVSGNRAVFEIDNTGSGGDILVAVGDWGPGGMGDEYNFHPLPAGADAICDAVGFDSPLILGDIEVGDDQPAPSGGDDEEDDEDDEDDDEEDEDDD
jgi:hypothetical protein